MSVYTSRHIQIVLHTYILVVSMRIKIYDMPDDLLTMSMYLCMFSVRTSKYTYFSRINPTFHASSARAQLAMCGLSFHIRT